MNKTAVITGAAGGIGSAIAVKFAHEGYNLVLIYNHSKAAAEALANSLTTTSNVILPIKADVTKSAEVTAAFEHINKVFPHVDVLVNAAGIACSGLLQDMSEEDWDKVLDTNLKSVFLTSRAALPAMINSGWGRIINISSIWGRLGASCEVAYSASKAAVDGFTKALAQEVAGTGITVNSISAGMIDTAMNACYSADEIVNFLSSVPLGRMGKASEIAEAVSFLAGGGAEYITGADIPVSGGK